MNISMKSGSVTINGKSYAGKNIIINNGKVIVDGVEQSEVLEHRITVNVVGEVDTLETTSGDVNVSGNVGSLQTTSGDIECQDVSGNVQTVSGDVDCGRVNGNVKTVSGDIKHNK